MMKRRSVFLVAFLMVVAVDSRGHVGNHPSVHDTVAGVVVRMRDTLPPDQLTSMTLDKVEAFLTDDEKHVLATEHITFRVDVPVIVSIVHDVSLREEPFWFEQEGFTKTDLMVRAENQDWDVWQKNFDAGVIGLGVNSLSGGGDHYFVAIDAQDPAAAVAISEVYPGMHTVGEFKIGETIHSDSDSTIETAPDSLIGDMLLRGVDDREEDAQLINLFRMTPYPSSTKPDHIVLTWSDDPKTTQTIQWRTSPEVATGAVHYIKKSQYSAFSRGEPLDADAATELLETPMVVNDPAVNRHTAVITGLEPDTTYLYSISDSTEGEWTEMTEFTTAPDRDVAFSFIYMGDAQNGLERWGSLIHNAFRERPDAAFYAMAGDLVNRGAERDDWDTLFENAEGVFDRRQLVPALGNHEYQGGNPELYLRLFKLMENGPDTIAPEKAYAFTYSNALFVVLDSNMPPDTQTAWLEEQLAGSDATWKLVMYHHPAYSSGANRDNPEVRKLWGDLFDKYHVDIALQGHDHAYLRTYPMKNQQRVASPAEGTIYIVSVSGTKFYEQGDFDYTEFGMTNVATYQTLDIQISGDRLVYRAYDLEGELRDHFIIEK